MPRIRQQIVALYLLACCYIAPLGLHADLLPGDFAIVRVAKEEIVLMALKQIPQNEVIRVTDDFWVNGTFDDSGNEAVFTINKTLQLGEQYLLDLSASGVSLYWNKTLHFYQINTGPYGGAERFLFMIEANLDGLSWFPSPPGLMRDLTHIVIRDHASNPGEIDHILDDSLVNRNLSPFRWLRALGSFRAWTTLNDFSYGPLIEFLEYQFSVNNSPGVITFPADNYQLSEQSNSLFVPVRRQFGSEGSATVNIEPTNQLAPLDSWSNQGLDDYYFDLTGIARSAAQDFTIALSPSSGELLRGDASGWVRADTNNQPETNLKLSGITNDGVDFWACSLNGKIYKSADGINWVEKYAPATGQIPLYRITYLKEASQANQPALIALGANGRILYEDPFDGWITSPSGITNERLFSICFDGFDYVAVGQSGTVIRSNNLSNGWQTVSVPTQANLYSITYAPFTQGGGFFAVGEGGALLHTSDLANGFSLVESGTRQTLSNVSFATIALNQTGSLIAEYVITCGAGGTITASKDGGAFELRRRAGRASALYSAVPIETGTNDTTSTWIAVGEYGAIVQLNLSPEALSGDPQNIQVDNNPTTSLTWANGESGEKFIKVNASQVDLFRQRIDLSLTRPATGSGSYRIGRGRTEINLMDASGANVQITPNFGPQLYLSNARVEINSNGFWELKFKIGNTSNVASKKLFLRFEGTNLADWRIPTNVLPGTGVGIAPLSESSDIVHIIRQPVETVSLYEEFRPGEYVRKYQKAINSLWVSPDWTPNDIFPRSLGVYLEDDGSLTPPGIPGINGPGGSN